uniref:Dynein regulatory complex subunit 2 n=1 Tax=Oryzias latipes TaxID=8090 RepID=A0A3P9HG88_ORYLA
MPKKAKKSLGRTEGERLVQLHHRAQAEEEMSKKKEEMLALFLKDKLQKEQRNTAVNLLKVTDRWRSIQRQARVTELRGNIVVSRQMFEREVDELNFVIEKLMGDLQGAERQTAHVQASHLQQLDHLLAQDLKRMWCLHQDWGGGLQDLSSSCSSEKQQMFAQFEEQRDKLQSKVFSADQHHKDAMQEIKKTSTDGESWFSSHSDPKNVQMGLRDNLHESISNILGSWKHNINNVKKKEEEVALLLDYVTQQLKITMRLKNKAEQLRDRVKVSEWEKEFMEENLTAYRNEMNLRFYQAQGQVASGRQATRKQLTQLAVQGDAAAEKQQAAIAQGEKVLRAAKMCLKLKLHHDVLPPLFAPLHLPPEEDTQGSEDVQDLQQRLTKAVLQRDALRKHKADLSQENVQLQLLLGQHTFGLHEDCCPLPTSQAPIISAPAAGQQRHTVIEAAHIAKYCL